MADGSKRTNVRNALIEQVKSDIVGPRRGSDEELPKREDPTQSYLSGILFPRMSGADPEYDMQAQIETEGRDSDDSPEERINPMAVLKQSSFGLTCTVPPATDSVLARVEYGTYDLVPKPSGKDKAVRNMPVAQGSKGGISDDDVESAGKKEPLVYRRTHHSHEIRLSITAPKPEIPLDARNAFALRYYAKEREGGLSLSVFVVNNNIWDGTIKEEFKKCMFQPRIVLSAPGGDRIFIDAEAQGGPDMGGSGERDSALFDLLFRKKGNFAAGHGCAVEWDNDGDKVSELWTTFTPVHTVPKIRPREMDSDGLDMEKLFRVKDRSEYRQLLSPVADEYERWIEGLEAKAKTLAGEFHETAAAQIKECRSALGRMHRGIEIVSTDKEAADAFSFANRAMWLQMSYGRWARKNAENGKADGPKPKEYSGKWRPFQLAFFLINVESITCPHSADRSVADLLWFATGGGKTEAYFGIIAFTIAHRRLRHETEHLRYGTAVMMRYTLRLLTLQQFHRAATLMCACECIRRKDPKMWGAEPFLVGLWVGSNTTPNTLDGEYGASEAIRKARSGNPPQEHSPLQLVSCPWCGSKINPYCYEVSKTQKQCRVYCPNGYCEFSKGGEAGLPVLVVDEDIYRRCPPLVIGTVDKFAQIAWKWETGAIFGRVNKLCEKDGFVVDELAEHCNAHRKYRSQRFIELGPPRLEPPELIIQDELHLISGPLGTLAGLYETAVDFLCTGDGGVRPKIIASTATTRRAAGQIRGLFNRDTSRIFPPQGIDFGQSFFAEEVPLDEDPGKAYMGICATARGSLNVLGRISAVILRCVRRVEEGVPGNGFSKSDIDQYYTLVSYFNSLRELGGASKMYDDSVPGHIKRLVANFERRDDRYRMRHLEKVELTSRVDSSEIPGILKRLERTLDGAVPPEDLLLCTNMLSVGVDVSRLGAMIVNGQPKNHSEYIQATGRVGRESPGLVVTNYNPLKPRDLSHYENFGHYHSALHKYVEPVNLTPFASRARDRALFGVLVALMRLSENKLAENGSAGKFDKNWRYVLNVLETVRGELSDRVANIDPQEKEATLRDLDRYVDKWHEYASNLNNLQYRQNPHKMAKRTKDASYLLKSEFHADGNGLIPVPNSLRDAEESISVWYRNDSPRGARGDPEGEA